jgi:DNA-directed RNA polymerase subunit RPC12/RpoP
MVDYRNYIHGKGYLKNYYVCSECGSRAMRHEPHSIHGRIYLCMECGSVEFDPQPDFIFPPVEDDDTAWIGMNDLLALIELNSYQLN